MRILIAIHLGFTKPYGEGRAGGSETWALTMADEFRRLGHDVFCTDSRKQTGTLDVFDLALTAHTTIPPKFRHLTCPKIHTCHGILPALEQPVPGADHYVAVSEEVQDHLAQRGYESTVIRNPIDCERFNLREPLRKDPPFRVLFYSRYRGEALPVCNEAFSHHNYHALRDHVWQSSAHEFINCHDLVIGLGRSALEAMACGRNVIVYDYNGGDGFATPESMIEFRKNNCSGRRYGNRYTAEGLRAIAENNYDPAMGARLRQYVIENNDVRKVAQAYLELI